MKYRNKIDIIYEILVISKQININKTRLVYRTNTNFLMIEKYLVELQEKGFLEKKITGMYLNTYVTTEKGLLLLEKIKSLKDNLMILRRKI